MESDKSKNGNRNAWIELSKLFLILAAVIAVRNSFGVFFTSIEEQFELTRGATSTFYSIFMILAAFFTILSGWLLDRFGPKTVFIAMGILTILSLLLTGQATSSWQLYFTYSLLLAAGTGGGFSLILATVSRWFTKRRGLALGIALSGEGIGTLAVAPLADFLITNYNWRIAYSTIGLLAGVIMIGIAIFLRKEPRNIETENSDNVNTNIEKIGNSVLQQYSFSLIESMKTRSFWFLGLVYMLFSLSFHLVLTHIVPHTTDMGITAANAAMIISIIGCSTIGGRLVLGWASDKTSRKMLAIYCALFQTAAMLWLAWSNSIWMFYAFAAAFGFTFGGLSNLMATLISDTFGMSNLGTITGAVVMGFNIGAAIGPALGGFIFDATGSYFVSFLTGTGAAIMAVLFLTLIRREAKVRQARISQAAG